MSERIVIWKHDCVRHGQGYNEPCDPPCEEPWQVDAPYPYGDTFRSHEAATAYVAVLIVVLNEEPAEVPVPVTEGSSDE